MKISLFTTALSVFAIAGLAEAVHLKPAFELAQEDAKTVESPVAEAAKQAEEKQNIEDAKKEVEQKSKQAAVLNEMRKGVLALRETKVAASESGIAKQVQEAEEKLVAKKAAEKVEKKEVKQEKPKEEPKKDLSTCLNDCLQKALQGKTATPPEQKPEVKAPATGDSAKSSEDIKNKILAKVEEAKKEAAKKDDAIAKTAVEVKETEKKVVEDLAKKGALSPEKAAKVTKKLEAGKAAEVKKEEAQKKTEPVSAPQGPIDYTSSSGTHFAISGAVLKGDKVEFEVAKK